MLQEAYSHPEGPSGHQLNSMCVIRVQKKKNTLKCSHEALSVHKNSISCHAVGVTLRIQIVLKSSFGTVQTGIKPTSQHICSLQSWESRQSPESYVPASFHQVFFLCVIQCCDVCKSISFILRRRNTYFLSAACLNTHTAARTENSLHCSHLTQTTVLYFTPIVLEFPKCQSFILIVINIKLVVLNSTHVAVQRKQVEQSTVCTLWKSQAVKVQNSFCSLRFKIQFEGEVLWFFR